MLPSFKISKTHRLPAPFSLPKQAYYGDSFIISTDNSIAQLNRNGIEPSTLGKGQADQQLYFFGVGLYDSPTIWISGVWQTQSLPLYRNFFNLLFSPEVNYFSEKIELQRPYPEAKVKLRLPSSVIKRIEEPDPNREKYLNAKSAVFQRTDGAFDPCWLTPLDTPINSPFGKPRTLPSGRSYYHSGVDLKASTGMPLPAVQSGEVVFADMSVVPGNTVLIYHGSGFSSQFMHMSQFAVKAGETVTRGQRVGLSGSTGRVEGPHLHWEIHWKGLKLDPLKFVSSTKQTCHILAGIDGQTIN